MLAPYKTFAAPVDGCVTTPDIEGPFYIPNSPISAQLAPAGAPGTTLFMTGTVYANDCITPVKNALVDVWQANDGGGYENTNYRARIYTDEGGNYAYQSVLPGKYLNGAQFRPRHIHYKVSGQGSPVITTQIYFEGDTSIPIDPWASVPEAADRIVPLTDDGNGNWQAVADIVLDVDPINPTGMIEEMNLEGGKDAYIMAAYPNPGEDVKTVRYHAKKSSDISLEVYSANGQKVNSISPERKQAGTHEVTFTPTHQLGFALPAGLYIIRLLTDGEAVDAKRLMIH